MLQSVAVELATQGDLKLCERPEARNLGPKEQAKLRANIKVSSTDTGACLALLQGRSSTGQVSGFRSRAQLKRWTPLRQKLHQSHA